NDILFTSGDGTTKLNHEIEKYDSATGQLVAWVQLPTLYAQKDTQMYLYYGNASASSQQSVTATWNSNYKAVWHLKEDPSGSAPQMQDSTSTNSGANDLTSNGSMPATAVIPGKIGNGI